jgi:tetratricopeptide (TPR) repeat protein
MDAGSFKEAHAKLQSILLKLPESEAENRAQVKGLIEKARRELQVDEDMAKLREFSKTAPWDQVVLAVGEFHKNHRETRRHIVFKSEADAILTKANEIGQFHTAVKEIRDAYAASDYAKVVLLVDQFNTRFATHALFDAVRGELADLAKSAQKSLLMPAEEKAKSEFSKAEAALDAKKFQEAIVGYDILLKDLSETELVKSNKTLIEQHRDLAVQGFRKERDADGSRKFKTAKTLFDGKNYGEALKILADLDKNYADVMPEKMKDVRQMLEVCQKEAAMEQAAMVDDGEKGIEGWVPGGATARVEIAEASEAKMGSKALKMTFKRHNESINAGTWPRLEHSVTPPSDETTALTFWAKSGNAQPFKVSIELRLYSGDDEVVYAATRTLGPGWQLYQIPLSEFKQIWQHPRRKVPAKLNAYNIQKVGFSTGQPAADASALIDHIRFESKR